MLAGASIRESCASLSDKMKPLGFGDYGIGFGSMIVTYRNCPNNAPLALWWGVDGAKQSRRWVPLFPRKGNGDVVPRPGAMCYDDELPF